MPDQIELVLSLDPNEQTDDEELARLTEQLRLEILELDVERVSLLRSGEKQAGAKSGDPVTLGALLIAALGSSGVVSPLIDLLKTWVSRHNLRSITLELDGDKLEVSGISPQEQQELIDAWMSRHKLILTADK